MATLQLMSSQNELTGVAQSHKNLVVKTQLHLKSQQDLKWIFGVPLG